MTASKALMFLPFVFLIGCSTTSTRTKILRDMAIGAGVGALAAQNRSDNRDAYTTMYAAIGAATSGAVSTYFRTPNADELKRENTSLKMELSEFRKKAEPTLIGKGSSLFQSPLPKEVSALVEPGEWRRYKMDQWIQDPNQPNTWFRQVEMFEIIPPTSK